jgi:hypothetical protein
MKMRLGIDRVMRAFDTSAKIPALWGISASAGLASLGQGNWPKMVADGNAIPFFACRANLALDYMSNDHSAFGTSHPLQLTLVGNADNAR